MDPKDQSNNPEEPPIEGDEKFSPHRAPLSDSPVGAVPSAGHTPPAIGTWRQPSPEELQRQFPQYEIRGVLGRGGMGAVYKAWQTSLQRFVAIKILPADVEDDGMDYAERFKQEARAMAKFSHPGIVAVYEAGETRERLLYFVMEYVGGKDVARIVTERGRLPAAEAIGIASRVCEAMAYAHERGVIHRDIKPSNVMIESDGTVKVADFGLAKFSSAERSVNTLSSLQIGSPDFMPPEALCGSENVDHRGDIYAVGGMLYQMLTGKAPHGRFEPPSVAVPGLDKCFDAIVDKAMHAEAGKRYSSANEMLAAITHAATIHNASSPGRRRMSKPLLSMLLAGITLVAAGLWKRQHSATPARGDARPEVKATPIPNPETAVAAPWHDAFAESPLAEIISQTAHTAQGYALPENNHWTISPQPMRSGALRIRATASGEKFASLYIAHDNRHFERVRFVGRNSEWMLSQTLDSTQETDLAARRTPSPLDEMPHELLLARIGGRLRVWVDGQSLMNEPDPNSTEGRFVLDIYPGAKISVEKVEYMELDGVPEAEALKRIGIAPGAKNPPD